MKILFIGSLNDYARSFQRHRAMKELGYDVDALSYEVDGLQPGVSHAPSLSARVLSKLGMKVAAISLMCQDENVWEAMMMAGTPCPIDGLIGEKAKARWIEKRKGNLRNQTTKPSMTWNE